MDNAALPWAVADDDLLGLWSPGLGVSLPAWVVEVINFCSPRSVNLWWRPARHLGGSSRMYR